MAIKKLSCPLMDTEIDEGICYDIHMNVEGLAPEWTIPEKVLETPDYKKYACNVRTIGTIKYHPSADRWYFYNQNQLSARRNACYFYTLLAWLP